MRVPHVADRQDGVFTRRQAHTAGWSYARIKRTIDRQEWVVVLGSALMASTTPRGHRQVARALQLETGAVVSHGSASPFFKLGVGEGLHVTIHPHESLTVPGVTVHHHPLTDVDVLVTGGIRVTGRWRTIVDHLASIPIDQARTLLYRAVQQDWCDSHWLAEAVETRKGWRGTPQLRELLVDCEPGAHSWLEARVLRHLRAARILGWTANAPVHDDAGLVGIVDLLFEAHKLVVEIDGQRYHGADRFQHDRTRQNRLVAAGYTVLRFTYADVVERPDYVLRSIRDTLTRLAA